MGVTIGSKYGKWTVVGRSTKKVHHKIYWDCICECGTTKIRPVVGSDLLNGKSSSCGCVGSRTRHGDRHTRFYRVWLGMCSRTRDTKDKYYGGRGITLCERWCKYENFKSDMFVAYQEHIKLYGLDTEIGRSNNNGSYCPENCQWVTRHEQLTNTTRTRKFEAMAPTGETYYGTDQKTFALIHNLNPGHVCDVLNGRRSHHKGWLFKPLNS